MKRFLVLFSSVMVMLGLVTITAPASSAVPLVQTQLVLYADAYYHTEIGRQSVAGMPGNCNDDYHPMYWYLPYVSMQNRASSVLLWVPSGYNRCNIMWVEGLGGQWWGTCISHDTGGNVGNGIPYFGPGYNDSLRTVALGHDVNCPAY